MSPILTISVLFLAIFWSVFLFWRACRHELIESVLALDTIIVATLGALIGARIFDFLVNISSTGLSIAKLVFFNVYGRFDFWGAIFGGGIAAFIFLSPYCYRYRISINGTICKGLVYTKIRL